MSAHHGSSHTLLTAPPFSETALPLLPDGARHQGWLRRQQARLLRSVHEWMQRERSIHELEAMTDRELVDIGLDRGSIRETLRAKSICARQS